MQPITVNAVWDDEARVWVATSEQVPGLVVEAENAELLESRLAEIIPELLKLNGLLSDEDDGKAIPFHLLQESVVITRAAD